MKRSEMLEKLVFSMEMHAGNDPAWLDYQPGMKAGALDYADKILRVLEEADMVYCAGEELGVFKLRVPKGWEPENEEK